MKNLNFLSKPEAKQIVEEFWTPCYVYSEAKLKEFANIMLKFPNAYGHQVRYAMKANPNKNIIKLFSDMWIYIDASSEYEVYRAIKAWVPWENIQISSQELSQNIEKLIDTWVYFVATSLNQLEQIWKLYPGKEIGVRINPGKWSWAFAKISTWWLTSSFGIWYEYISEIKDIVKKYNLNITKIHIHIWSENTPESWVENVDTWLDIVKQFENVECLNMWGWFKMAIMPYETSADIKQIWEAVKLKFEEFYKNNQRKIKLEVEPWKYLVINACSVLTRIQDIVDTWKQWYNYIKIDSWMTEMPRVSMYWVQEPIHILNDSAETEDYVVVGHCCESWDIITSKLYEPEVIESRKLPKSSIWDIMVIEWTWAYNASMSMKNYNSFPETSEVMIKTNWKIQLIRTKQELIDIIKNEI